MTPIAKVGRTPSSARDPLVALFIRNMPITMAGMLLVTALAADPQTGSTVQGRVISSAHNEPIAKAVVTLRELQASGGAPPQTYICQTGSDGRFSIAGVAPGVYDARPSKQGFEARSPERPALAHEFPPVTVEAGKPVTGLELRLIPNSVIAGKVLDADGDPVRYAQVEAQEYGYVAGEKQLRITHQVQTNDRGEYRMFNLAPGRYYMHAQATPRSSVRMMNSTEQVRGALPPTAMAAAFYPGVADPSHATELDAQPGGELDGIDFHLAPEKRYSIRGKLPASDPAKVRRSVRVAKRAADLRQPPYNMWTSGDSYEVRDIGPGAYTVIGQLINPTNPEERQFAIQPVDVIDRDVDGVDLTFSPGIQLKGTVKVEGSAPLPLQNVAVRLQGADLSMQQAVKVAPDGKFATAEMAPGIYQVRVAGRAYLKSVRVGDQVAPEGKVDIEHLSGPVTVVVSADFGQVEGTVTDEAGKPVYNVNVTLIPDQSRPDWQDRFSSRFTSIAGKFSFVNVPPGDYRAYAWIGVEPGAPESADFRKPYEDRATAIKVEPNGRQTLDLKPIILAPVH